MTQKFRIDSDGGPAFPRPGAYTNTVGMDITDIREAARCQNEPTAGMSLLDYYIGQALAGMLANPTTRFPGPFPPTREDAIEFCRDVGKAAVSFAVHAMTARAEYLALPRPPRVAAEDD